MIPDYLLEAVFVKVVVASSVPSRLAA